jgi:cupin 2 domain-containing protein
MVESGNLFSAVPGKRDAEEFKELLSVPGIRIERIVSTGQISPPDFWYDQDKTEWVLVVNGAAEILFEGESEARRMAPGDYLCISPHRRHRVVWTDPARPTIWLAIHIGDAVSRVPGSDGPLSSTVLPSGSVR